MCNASNSSESGKIVVFGDSSCLETPRPQPGDAGCLELLYKFLLFANSSSSSSNNLLSDTQHLSSPFFDDASVIPSRPKYSTLYRTSKVLGHIPQCPTNSSKAITAPLTLRIRLSPESSRPSLTGSLILSLRVITLLLSAVALHLWRRNTGRWGGCSEQSATSSRRPRNILRPLVRHWRKSTEDDRSLRPFRGRRGP